MNGQQPDGTYRVEKVAKPQLHVSALGMKCMEAFRRSYIMGEKIPPGVRMIVGTGTHRGVDANMKHKIETGELLPLDAVTDATRDGLNAAWEREGVTLDPDELARGMKLIRGEAVDKAVRLVKLHHAETAPKIKPIHAERAWSLEIAGKPFDFVGQIDIQEANGIRDTKTAAKTPSEDCADKSLQLKSYAMAVKALDGKIPEKVSLDFLIDIKTPKAKTFDYAPDAEDFSLVLNRLDTVAYAMEKGVFVPVEPDHWCCDPKWCGYYSTCKYVRRPKQFAA